MLQKEFFMAQSFNPGTVSVLDLSGSAKYEENTVFPVGKYSIDVQAGDSSYSQYSTYNVNIGNAGRITTIIDAKEPFIIRAYCGSKATGGTAGTNPYAGEFKINASTETPPIVTHIFGNRGGISIRETLDGPNVRYPGGGNCLGNGINVAPNAAFGAGSCLHLIPLGGVFGEDYLFAFHTTSSGSGAAGKLLYLIYPSGSAYGGGGGPEGQEGLSINGGDTPYGSGGTYCKSGTGVGAGIGAHVSKDGFLTPGAAAWFDGQKWTDSGQYGNNGEEGHIIIKYLGAL